MRHLRSQRGLTLVEIVVTMALLSSALTVAVLAYTSISKLQQKGISVRAVQQNGRYALETVVREIRNSAGVNVISPTKLELSASNSTSEQGGKIIYEYNASSQKLIRTYTPQFGSPEVKDVATGSVRITAFTFAQVQASAQSKPVIEIYMKVKQLDSGVDGTLDTYNYDYEMRTSVTPRDS